MTSHKLCNSVLEKIQKENIKPKPHWHFWLINSLFWMTFSLSVFIGARAVGVMIHAIGSHDLSMIAAGKGPLIKPLWMIFPFFWSSIFLLFLILAILGLHQTKRGYRLNIWHLIGINLGLSIVIGVGAYAVGDGERFEEFMRRQAPIFSSTEEKKEAIWSQPNEGRIAGIIIELKDNKSLILNDLRQHVWVVDYSQTKQDDFFTIQVQQQIRVIGEPKENNIFHAEIIRPWIPNRRGVMVRGR